MDAVATEDAVEQLGENAEVKELFESRQDSELWRALEDSFDVLVKLDDEGKLEKEIKETFIPAKWLKSGKTEEKYEVKVEQVVNNLEDLVKGALKTADISDIPEKPEGYSGDYWPDEEQFKT